MKIKKINAVLSLITVLLLVAHIGYNAFCFLTMYYNPVLKQVFSVPFMTAVLLHAVLGMLSVFLLSDGTNLTEYPRQNWKTILQRTTAALFFPLLLVHINSFDIYTSAASEGKYFLFYFIMFCDVCFYFITAMHVSVSISRALVTLGLISSPKTQQKIDNVALTVALIVVIIAGAIIVRGLISMFFH